MDPLFLRAACAIFLVILGGARVYYSLESMLHPHETDSPHVG